MVDITKVRYAVIVAVIGIAVSLIPGLTDIVQEPVRYGSVIVAWLWTILRIAQEFVAPDAPAVNREVDGGGFWDVVKRAL
tara:strand:- start:1610 stop:1849 length:240 start_codon:yes stop_codon:yes gene_type:complete